MYVLVVQLEIREVHRRAFLAAVREYRRETFAQEGGEVARFDLITDAAHHYRLYAYEVYRDEAASAAHRQTPHYQRFAEAAASMLAAPPTVLARGKNVLPPDGDPAWQ